MYCWFRHTIHDMVRRNVCTMREWSSLWGIWEERKSRRHIRSHWLNTEQRGGRIWSSSGSRNSVWSRYESSCVCGWNVNSNHTDVLQIDVCTVSLVMTNFPPTSSCILNTTPWSCPTNSGVGRAFDHPFFYSCFVLWLSDLTNILFSKPTRACNQCFLAVLGNLEVP